MKHKHKIMERIRCVDICYCREGVEARRVRIPHVFTGEWKQGFYEKVKKK